MNDDPHADVQMHTRTHRHTNTGVHMIHVCVCASVVSFSWSIKNCILRFFTFFDILLSCCLISVQNGYTPMYLACVYGRLDTVKVLHSAGGDASIKGIVSS